MPLIQVIKDNKEFHLESWNEDALIELGIDYELIPVGNRFYLLYTVEQLQSLIETN
jgi:hypothetical protein